MLNPERPSLPLDNRLAQRAAWFGFGAALTSSAGQTFFIGLFGREFQAALDIDQARLGGLYAVATLASAVLMFWLGETADRIRLSRAIALAVGVLGSGALLVATARNPAILLLALFLLRLGGQGLTGHLAIVAAVRFGGPRAGRGVSTAAFGFILGEALFPFLVSQALGVMTWRAVWMLVAAALLVALFGLHRAAAPFAAPTAETSFDTSTASSRFGRVRLLQTPAFLAALSVLLVSAFVITAVFLHQGALAWQLGWPDGSLPGAFLAFASAQAVANYLYGRIVDRVGVLRVVMVYLLPLALGLLSMTMIGGRNGLWLGFIGLGLTAGGQGVVGGALWLPLFGPAQLGMVRGIYVAMMVLASAISPWLLGRALVSNASLTLIAGTCAVYAVIVPLLAHTMMNRAAQRRAAAS